ncbi:MAG: hypothetical protein HQ492_08865 [Woeseiaceae bacterium]|nr:hypothetical protein [Woeseiaceae bacterium]
MAALHERVVAVTSLRNFFRESINSAIDNQHVDVDPHTSHYVVNLLTLFARSEKFYNEDDERCGVRPLALMMADAVAAESQERRSTSLQRIGDVALFTAGFFADSLAYRPVDIDYYVSMGGSAYGSLSDEIKGTTRGMALVDEFRELARKFQSLVDVLNEVRDGARLSTDVDVVRTYEVWRKTGSKRAATILEQNGVVPIFGASKTH